MKIFCLIIGAALLYGCTNPTGTKARRSQYVSGVAATTDTVFIVQMKFQPEELHVSQGDTVVFVNMDIVKHNVTDEKNHAWASPTLNHGDVWCMIASKDEEYFCSLHVVMKGKIDVE